MARFSAAITALAAFGMVSTGIAADIYENEADFLAAIEAEYLLEDFDWCVCGNYNANTLDLGPEHGYSCIVSTTYGQWSLWSGDGNMSTQANIDRLRIDFTGAPVTAVGGWFFGGLLCGEWHPNDVIIELSDGTVHEFSPPSSDPNVAWRGFTNAEPFTWMTIHDPDDYWMSWPVMDHFYVGAKKLSVPGDLDGDGCVDQADLGILLSDWDCTGGDCPGDCDSDGDTDHADLGILLGHWGEGCP